MRLWQLQRTKVLLVFLLLLIVGYGGYRWQRASEIEEQLKPEVTVTFPEGLTLLEIGESLEKAKLTTVKEFTALNNKNQWPAAWLSDYPFLSKVSYLEGYLFPDTYRFYTVTTPAAIISRLLDNFATKTKDLGYPTGAAKGKTFAQLVIMASIIEKEVRLPQDMAVVSDIFWKRFNGNRGLDADSTLNYILRTKQTALSAKDLRTDSPYNTYRYRGLPPTPISNPGLSALKAAWYPATSPYWYFLTDKEGKVYFAENLEEHNVNKGRYR